MLTQADALAQVWNLGKPGSTAKHDTMLHHKDKNAANKEKKNLLLRFQVNVIKLIDEIMQTSPDCDEIAELVCKEQPFIIKIIAGL